MRYQLLALDLDGTVYRHNKTIAQQDIDAVLALQNSGVPVTIITGRLYGGTREAIEQLHITGPVACNNGAHIICPQQHRDYFAHTLPHNDIEQIQSILAPHKNLYTYLLSRSGIYHHPDSPHMPYVSAWSPRLYPVEVVWNPDIWHQSPVLTVMTIGPEETINPLVETIRNLDPNRIDVITFPTIRLKTNAQAMLVRLNGTSKGTAVNWLAEYWKCSPEKVVVVGDWLNDLSMFASAGRSFAMGQALPDVKEQATDSLRATDDAGGGVAEAIRTVWGL